MNIFFHSMQSTMEPGTCSVQKARDEIGDQIRTV